MKKITLSPWDSYTEGTVPAIYDKGLSYEQQVAYLRYHVRELDRHVSELSKALGTAQGKINILVNKVYAIQNEIAGIINDVQSNADDIADLEEATKELQTDIAQILQSIVDLRTATENIDSQIQKVVSSFNLEIAGLHNDISKLYSESVKYLDEFQKEMRAFVERQTAAQTGTTLLVENPVTEQITSLNRCLDDLYSVLATYGGITRVEYDRLGLTLEEYAGYNLTPSVYYTRALFIFFPLLLEKQYQTAIERFKEEVEKRLEMAEKAFKEANTVIIPYTGQEGSTAELAVMNANQHCGSPTVEEYAGMMVDADTYDSYQMTCGDYFKQFMTEWIYENSGLKAITSLEDQCGMGERFTFMINVNMSNKDNPNEDSAAIYIPVPGNTANYNFAIDSCTLIGAYGNVKTSINASGLGYSVTINVKYLDEDHGEPSINLGFILGRKGI